MTYQDYLQSQGLGTANTQVPGVQAPVTLQPIAGTQISPETILAQQFQASRNQAVLTQKAADDAAVAQAYGAAQQQRQEEEKRHRGGGIFSPITRMVSALADYPEQMGAALGNIADNPFSPGAYGQAALAFASPAGAIAGVPQDYTKLGFGSIIYHAAKGDVGWIMNIAAALGPVGSGLPAISAALNLGMTDDMKKGVINAHDMGYKDFTQGNGVWEYMQSSMDDLPDVVRYPLRAIIEIGVDPLTYVGIGAAKQGVSVIGKGANLNRGAELAAMGPMDRIAQALKSTDSLGSKVRDVVIPQGFDPIRETDRAARALNAPFDMALGGIGKTAKYGLEKSGLSGLGRMTAGKQAEKLSRQQMWSTARFERNIEDLTADTSDALVQATPGFTTTAGIGSNGERIYRLESANDPTLVSEIRIDPEGNVRVFVPGDNDGQRMPSLAGAITHVRSQDIAYAKNIRNTYDSNPPKGIRLIENATPFAEGVDPVTGKQIINEAKRPEMFEVQHETRGSAYAVKEGDSWVLYDGDRNAMGATYKDPKEAYKVLTNHLLGREYPMSTLPNGVDVGPSFGFNPKGSRPQDIVNTRHQDDPRRDLFNERLGKDLPTLSEIIKQEDAKVAAQSDQVLMRDLDMDELEGMNRGRTMDTPTKSMAEVKGTLVGQRHYGDIFGEPEVPFAREWKEDSARTIRDYRNKVNQKGKPALLKDQLNSREAIKQAMFTKNPAEAEEIISYFERSSGYRVDAQHVEALLIDPVASADFIKKSKGKTVHLGRLLRENRRVLDEAQGVRRPNTVPTELIPDSGLALPERTGPLPEATAVGSSDDAMMYADQVDRFVPPAEGPAVPTTTGKTRGGTLLDQITKLTDEDMELHKARPLTQKILDRQKEIKDEIERLHDEYHSLTTDERMVSQVLPGGDPIQSSFLAGTKQTSDLDRRIGTLSDEIEALSTDEVTGQRVKGSVAKRARLEQARRELADLEEQRRGVPEIGATPEIALGDRTVSTEPVTHILGEPGQLRAPRPKAGTPIYQQLTEAGDDPVKRQQVTETFVNEITQGTPKKVDPQQSGFNTYLVRGEEGAPEISVHVGDDNNIIVTALDPNDPEVRNIVARAGTDVPVTVKQGMPDPIGQPGGLTTAGTVDEPGEILDPVYRWQMLDNGVTDEDVANMSRVIDVEIPDGVTAGGKTKVKKAEMRVADFYILVRGQSDAKTAFERTHQAIRAANMPAKDKMELLDRLMSKKLIRYWDAFIAHQRDVLMFNWATGAPAGLLDHLGDTWRMASKGYIKEAITASKPDIGAIALGVREGNAKGILKGFVPQPMRQGFQEAQGSLNAMMLTDDGRTLMAIGAEEVPNVSLGIGREETVRGKGTQLRRSLEKQNVSPKTAKRISQAAGTVMMDGSEFMMTMRSAGDLSRRFTMYAGAIKRQLPQAREDFMEIAKDWAQKNPDFDLATFDDKLGTLFSPNDVRIRAVEAGLDKGKAEQLRRSWTTKVTDMEKSAAETLDEVLFSYEANRADEVLKRIFLFHYWYTRATLNYTRTIIANPYLYVNYQRAMDGLERGSEGEPSSVKGLIKAFSGPGGFQILMDPLKAITTAVSFRRAAFSDGEGTAFDAFMSQSGLFLNPALQGAMAFLGLAQNDNVDPFATFQMRRIFGATANLVNADMGGGMLGSPYQQAMNDAVEKGSSFWSQILPGSQTRYARDAKANDKVLIRNTILDKVIADLGIDPDADFGQWTPQQIQTLEAAYDALDTGMPNPYADAAYRDWAHSNMLRTGLSMTAPVGTALRSETRDERMNEARRFEDPATGEMMLPPDSMAAQQQRDIPASQPGVPTNLAISDAQFDSLFPANEKGRVSVSADGQTQDEVMGQPQNEDYLNYRTWKGTVDDKRAFRTQMEQASPAYKLYLDDLRQTEPFASDENALDNAGVSFGAYIVLNGSKGNVYDRNNPPVLDPTKVNPASLFGSQAGAGSYGGSPQTTDDLAGYIASQLMSYQEDQKAFQAAASKMYGQPIQFDLISPQAQRMIRNELSKFGVRIPQLGDAASGYQAWARVQPMGTDTSIEAYIRSLGSRIPLTQSPPSITM